MVDLACNFMAYVNRLYKYHELMDNFSNVQRYGIIAQINYIRPIAHRIVPRLQENFDPANAKSYEAWTLYLDGVFKLYNENNHLGALNRINRILCYLPKEHRMKSWCYLQRCKVLVKMGRLEECRQNLKLIRYCDLQVTDDRIAAHLIQLYCIACGYRSLKDDIQGLNLPLNHQPHSKIQYAAECLQISEYDSHLGLATRRKLDAFDLLAIEEPYCLALHPNAVFGHCTFCHRENYYDMIPCTGCRNAMFCNEDCLRSAYKRFHRLECAVWPMFYRMFGKASIAVHILCVSIPLFDTFEDFMEFCRDPKNREHNIYSIDYDSPDRKIEQFKAVLGLLYNKNKREKIDPFYHSVMTLLIHKHLLLLTPFGKMLDTDEKTEFLLEILYELLIIAIFHCAIIPLTKIRDFNDEPEMLGLGIYPFCTLVAESDSSDNAVRMYYKGKSYLYTMAALPRYSELYINYEQDNQALLDSDVASS